jgi:hypothetical protein
VFVRLAQIEAISASSSESERANEWWYWQYPHNHVLGQPLVASEGDNMVQVIAVVAATMLIAVVWVNVLRTVFVPRQDPPRLPRWMLRGVAALLVPAGRGLSGRRRDRVLTLIAPVSLFALFAVWLAGLLAGVAVAAWGLAGVGLDPESVAGLLAFRASGAITGLALFAWLAVAVLIGVFMVHLVRVTEAYGRRELLVARLAAQAAQPPDAERILAAYVRSDSRDGLGALFAEWNSWLADIRCTHAGYPALIYYRPATDLSWLEAAVIVLDTAALVESIAPSWALPNTCGLIDTGVHCLKRLGTDLGIVLPRSEVSLHWREQCGFADTIRLASAAGLPVERSPQDVWRVFQDMRTRYAPYAAAIGSVLHYEVADVSFDASLLLTPR